MRAYRETIKKSEAMSYSHKDREWLQKLQTMLRLMVRNTSNHFNRLASDPCQSLIVCVKVFNHVCERDFCAVAARAHQQVFLVVPVELII
jgi:hypothetical protein